MLLIMVYIAYHDVFVGGGVIFDGVDHLSEFAVRHLFSFIHHESVQ